MFIAWLIEVELTTNLLGEAYDVRSFLPLPHMMRGTYLRTRTMWHTNSLTSYIRTVSVVSGGKIPFPSCERWKRMNNIAGKSLWIPFSSIAVSKSLPHRYCSFVLVLKRCFHISKL